MTNITPKPKKIGYLHLTANTPGHPDQEEAKAQLAELAGVTREPVVTPEPVAETKNFSLELAQQLINSDEQFPVSLDDAWQWLGYGKKQNALDSLKSYFEEGLDFSRSSVKSPTGGRPSDIYLLTVDCFKQLGMLAKTAQGKQIRLYFLECERIAKQSIAQPEPEPEPQPAPVASQTEQPKIGSSLEATADAIEITRRFLTNVNESLVNGFLLNQLQKFHPEMKSVVDDAHTLLAATNPIPELLLNPTDIGKRLGLKPQEVNQLLIDHGYQVKNVDKSSKTQPDYLPTEKGKPFSNLTLATGKNKDNSSFQHLKWKDSIIEELQGILSLASI